MRVRAQEPSLSTLSQDLLVGFPEAPGHTSKGPRRGGRHEGEMWGILADCEAGLGVLCFLHSDDVFYYSCDSGDPSGTPRETRGAECLGTRAGTGRRKEAARPGRAATGFWRSDPCPACSRRLGHQ